VGGIVSLQLCCNRINNEHILRRSLHEEYLQARVDSSEDKPGRAMSAILVTNGVSPANLVREDFLKAALEIPDEVATLSCRALRTAPPEGAGVSEIEPRPRSLTPLKAMRRFESALQGFPDLSTVPHLCPFSPCLVCDRITQQPTRS
jgi:hypothetical protein